MGLKAVVTLIRTAVRGLQEEEGEGEGEVEGEEEEGRRRGGGGERKLTREQTRNPLPMLVWYEARIDGCTSQYSESNRESHLYTAGAC